MKYDSMTCTFVDLESGDLDEVIVWLERIRRNEYEPEPTWARACIEDGDFVKNESDRRFYTSTKMYQEVALLVVRHLMGTLSGVRKEARGYIQANGEYINSLNERIGDPSNKVVYEAYQEATDRLNQSHKRLLVLLGEAPHAPRS